MVSLATINGVTSRFRMSTGLSLACASAHQPSCAYLLWVLHPTQAACLLLTGCHCWPLFRWGRASSRATATPPTYMREQGQAAKCSCFRHAQGPGAASYVSLVVHTLRTLASHAPAALTPARGLCPPVAARWCGGSRPLRTTGRRRMQSPPCRPNATPCRCGLVAAAVKVHAAAMRTDWSAHTHLTPAPTPPAPTTFCPTSTPIHTTQALLDFAPFLYIALFSAGGLPAARGDLHSFWPLEAARRAATDWLLPAALRRRAAVERAIGLHGGKGPPSAPSEGESGTRDGVSGGGDDVAEAGGGPPAGAALRRRRRRRATRTPQLPPKRRPPARTLLTQGPPAAARAAPAAARGGRRALSRARAAAATQRRSANGSCWARRPPTCRAPSCQMAAPRLRRSLNSCATRGLRPCLRRRTRSARRCAWRWPRCGAGCTRASCSAAAGGRRRGAPRGLGGLGGRSSRARWVRWTGRIAERGAHSAAGPAASLLGAVATQERSHGPCALALLSCTQPGTLRRPAAALERGAPRPRRARAIPLGRRSWRRCWPPL